MDEFFVAPFVAGTPFSHQNPSPGPVWAILALSWPSCTGFGSHFGRFGPLFRDSGCVFGALLEVLWEIWSLHFRHDLGTQGVTNDEPRTNHKHHDKHGGGHRAAAQLDQAE